MTPRVRRSLVTIALLVGLPVAWYLASPLWIDQTVDEALPGSGPATASGDRTAAMADAMRQAARAGDRRVDETMDMSGGPVALSNGDFRDADAVHKGEGKATVYRLADGSHVLRLTQFAVTNGPDLVVFLARHPDPDSAAAVNQGYLRLGPLKGNIGNQNYAIPPDTALDDYHSAVIWCDLFGVLFSPAPLTPITEGSHP